MADYSIEVNGVRQSVRCTPLTEQCFDSLERGGFQRAARTAVESFWRENHTQDERNPQTFDETMSALCEIYDTSVPDTLRTCIAWYAGFSEAMEAINDRTNNNLDGRGRTSVSS